MKYYLIAGEASGDLHGSNLMKGLKKSDANAEFRFFGGDLMHAQGGQIVKHYKELAFMGLDVIFHLRTILKNMDWCKQDILKWKPDVLILIDYPGFNLRIAEFAHSNGIKVFYYIAPKVWAWKENRVHKLRQYVDKLFVIFPFEIEYFKKFGVDAEYYGNPLKDPISELYARKTDFKTFVRENGLEDKPYIALVAGSRRGEIKRLLPVMLEATEDFSNYQLVVAGAPSIHNGFYSDILKARKVKVVFGKTYDVMVHAKVAIVTSGTATLETALLKTPQVVVFKTSPLAYIIGKSLVKIKYFSLPNIILDKMAVKELLQLNLVKGIKAELELLLSNREYLKKMLDDYNELERLLGNQGVGDRVAERMIALLKQ